jgi:alanyl-tRNA synthetase
MTHQEIRTKFIEYFKSKGHLPRPSSSLLPTDPSVLFTTAGMQQFKPYYTNPENVPAQNVISIQKCLRTSDIDEVGDESHLTFFEMLGNFSFGGYWKKEAIQYAHEFITKEMGLKINYVSIFGGEGSVPADEESEKIWQAIDPALEIKRFGRSDNFWGPTGNEGPCGPTSEIYVNGIEIWNLVFNEYYQSVDGGLEPLKIKGIDTGMGLERLAMMVQEKPNIFETDLFKPLVEKIRELISGVSNKSERVISDHLRASLFLLADGVVPSNKDQGYILRRLIRRAITHANILDINFDSKDIKSVATIIIETYKNYPELKNEKILEELSLETRKFRKTIENGLRELNKIDTIDSQQAFKLYESFGLPFEVIKEVGKDKATGLTWEAFEEERKRHQEISRAGAEKKFGGHGMKEGDLMAGDVEELKKKTRLHTATHLVVAALEKVLGEKLKQAGADITVERLRFDFAFPRKVAPEELKQAEEIANKAVDDDLPITWEEVNTDNAFTSGASGAFRHKYGDRVKVYTMGDKDQPFSKEICGGPHVTHTGEVGHIHITKEESVSGGNRRIRATIE